MKNYSVEEMKATVRHGKAQMPGFGASIIVDQTPPRLLPQLGKFRALIRADEL